MSKKIRWFGKNNNDRTTFFDIKDGYVYSDNLSEQLDSATIVINKIDKTEFESFDIIEIVDYTDSPLVLNTMLIDEVIESQVAFNPAKYDYTLKLMSNTKRLERTVIPNCSFTKPQGQNAITLKTAIEILLEDYSPKYLTQNNTYVQLYTLSSLDYGKLNYSCPDIYIGKGTLRSAIDKVLSTISCICKLDFNNKVRVVELNKKGSEIDLTKVNYNNENQSSSDYASTLDNQYNNIIASTDKPVKNYTLVSEYIGFRTENSGVLTTNNAELLTSYPIYDIKQVTICFAGSKASSQTYREVGLIGDSTWYNPNYKGIVEKQNFDSLDYDIKGQTAFFVRGAKNISIYGSYKLWGWFDIDKLENIINQATLAKDNDPQKTGYGLTTDWYKTMFKVEYYTQVDNVRAKSGKYLPESTENNEIIDNPGEAYVDIYQQGKLFNEKCNRLGNRVKVITGRYLYSDTLPELGDTIGDYVLMNREITYYDEFILFRGTLTENFVNINYFTGINARKRSWQIVSQSEAFDKQLIDKYYCELSFSSKTGADVTNKWTSYTYLATSFLSPFVSYVLLKPLKKLTVEGFYDKANADGTYTDNQYYHYELELNSYISGNSILFHSDFYDNYSAGIKLIDTTTGGYKQGWCSYVDKYGRNYSNDWFHYMLICDFSPWGQKFTPLQDGDAYDNSIYLNMFNESKTLPALSWTNSYKQYLVNNEILFDLTSTNYLVNHKDSREKIGLNIQFEFCSDTKDIIVGPKLLERQKMISTTPTSTSGISIYGSNTDKYNYGDTTGHGLELGSSVYSIISVTNDNQSAKLSFNDQRYHTEDYKYIGICDANGNLILGINKDAGEDIPDIYLNILRTRDRRKFTNSSLKNWI